MALTTITFDTLRERNNTLLANAGIDKPACELSKAEIRRIANHLPARIALEELAASGKQREAYGTQKWDQNFIRLRDLEPAPDSAKTALQLRQVVWDALPNSRFKRFQELFSHPHQVIVPRSMFSDSDHIIKPDTHTLNTCSLQGCLISADLIDDNFASQIGLVTFSNTELRRPAERLRRKADVSVLQNLKKLFEQSTPLDEKKRDHRVLLINNPEHSLHGSFFYTRQTGSAADHIHSENGQIAMRRLSIQFFPGAYEVFRKTQHTQSGYRLETGALSEMQNDLQQLVKIIDRDWRAEASPESKDILRTRAIEIIARHHSTLENCPNEYKQAATVLLASSAELRDSLGRTNPAASMAKLNKAARTILKRMEEIRPKGRFNTQDSMLISGHIAANEAVFKRFRSAVEANAQVLDPKHISRLAVFSEKPLSALQLQSNLNGLLVRLGVHPDDFKDIQMQPFLPFAKAIQQQLLALRQAVADRNPEEAQRALVKSYLNWKLYAVHITFEHTKEKIAHATTLSLQEIRDFVGAVHTMFQARPVLPDVVVSTFEKPFMQMTATLLQIKQRLSAYSEQGVTLTEQARIYKDFKKYLDTFDLVETLRELNK